MLAQIDKTVCIWLEPSKIIGLRILEKKFDGNYSVEALSSSRSYSLKKFKNSSKAIKYVNRIIRRIESLKKGKAK